MGATIEEARAAIRLVMLVNDVSLRGLIPAELAKGFGFFQSKPSSAFSPVAVTPDELGDAWDGGKLHLPLLVDLNGKPFGRANAGIDMTFDFGQLIAHAGKTRPLCAGTIIGSGTVSNKLDGGPGKPVSEGGVGYSCIAEIRMIETIETGAAATPFMRFGDTVRIEMKDEAGHSIFGAIEQTVTKIRKSLRRLMSETVLFDYWRSSASYRVRIALNMLAIPYRSVPVDLLAKEHKQAEHLARNPQGLVPALAIDGQMLTQSLAIIEYLAETRPACRPSACRSAWAASASERCPTPSPWKSIRSAISASSAHVMQQSDDPDAARIGMDGQIHRRGPRRLRADAGQTGNRRILPRRPTHHGRSLPCAADLQRPALERRSFRLPARHGHRGKMRASARLCGRPSRSGHESPPLPSKQTSIVLEYQADAAALAHLLADLICLRPRLARNAGNVAGPVTEAAVALAQNERPFGVQRRRQLADILQEKTAGRRWVEVSGELRAPGRPFAFGLPGSILETAAFGKRDTGLQERLVLVEFRRRFFRWAAFPLFDGVRGYRSDITPRFERQSADLEERCQTVLTGIVGGCGKAQIAEAVAQVIEIGRRCLERAQRVVTVLQTPQFGGARHELRDPLGAFRAHRVGPETAFAPDQPREIIRRKLVGAREMIDGRADIRAEAVPSHAKAQGRRQRPPESKDMPEARGSLRAGNAQGDWLEKVAMNTPAIGASLPAAALRMKRLIRCPLPNSIGSSRRDYQNGK